jgi:hypothetical protein
MSRTSRRDVAPAWHPLAKPFAVLQAPAAPRVTLIGLGVIAVLLLALDFLGLRHASYWPETVPGVWAFMGFGAVALLVALGYILHPLLVMPADAYRVEGEDE